MPRRPKFDAQESYLIDSVKKGSFDVSTELFGLSYLAVGIAVASWGAINNSVLAVFAGLAVFTLGRMQEWKADRQWRPIWQAILGKYDKAIERYEKAIEKFEEEN